MMESAATIGENGKTAAPAPNDARGKICSIDQLAKLSEDFRRKGLRVVLAHGTFDLLHLGHVRYLEEARAQGDILIVTLTADDHVNKGPGRPIFPDSLRAEMLGAVSYVDWVGINDAPTAVNIIKAIKPHVYVKGPDYRKAEDDLTGKIIEEQAAVESYGGRIHFTDNITFSSTSLLNRHFEVFDPDLRAYLDEARRRGYAEKLPDLLDMISGMRVLLVGETIIDEYQYVSPLGRPSKEPIVATLACDQEVFVGGVIAAANHVAGFCAKVEVLTCLGGVESREREVRAALRTNVTLHAVHRPDAPTIRKRRYVDVDYLRKLFEVYVMDDNPMAGELEARFVDEIERLAPQFDVVVVADFGHGLVTPAARDALLARSKFVAVNTQTNSGNHGYNLVTKYPRADYVCIDAPEARLAVVDKESEIEEVALKLREKLLADRLIVTHGRFGCLIYSSAAGARRVPAFTRRVLDTMGAGDAFLAVTAPLVAAGADMEMVGFVGNAVGAIKVGIVGHRSSVEKSALLKYFQTLLK